MRARLMGFKKVVAGPFVRSSYHADEMVEWAMRVPVRLPDLGCSPVRFGLWLVEPGERVYEGDRLAEMLLPGALHRRAAPATGTLVEQPSYPRDPVAAGQVLGYVEAEDDMMRGLFLSLDGLDGTGKSTQHRLLVEWLRGLRRRRRGLRRSRRHPLTGSCAHPQARPARPRPGLRGSCSWPAVRSPPSSSARGSTPARSSCRTASCSPTSFTRARRRVGRGLDVAGRPALDRRAGTGPHPHPRLAGGPGGSSGGATSRPTAWSQGRVTTSACAQGFLIEAGRRFNVVVIDARPKTSRSSGRFAVSCGEGAMSRCLSWDGLPACPLAKPDGLAARPYREASP
ncbi:MAG: hypothetical protein U0797_28270 [Gemmataceae bacterium]